MVRFITKLNWFWLINGSSSRTFTASGNDTLLGQLANPSGCTDYSPFYLTEPWHIVIKTNLLRDFLLVFILLLELILKHTLHQGSTDIVHFGSLNPGRLTWLGLKLLHLGLVTIAWSAARTRRVTLNGYWFLGSCVFGTEMHRKLIFELSLKKLVQFVRLGTHFNRHIFRRLLFPRSSESRNMLFKLRGLNFGCLSHVL